MNSQHGLYAAQPWAGPSLLPFYPSTLLLSAVGKIREAIFEMWLFDHIHYWVNFPLAASLVVVAILVTRRGAVSLVWWAASLLFLVLGGFAIRKTLLGHASCGCFGDLRTPPQLVAGLDFTLALICAVLARVQGRTAASDRCRGLVQYCCLALVAVGAVSGLSALLDPQSVRVSTSQLTAEYIDEAAGIFETQVPVRVKGGQARKLLGAEASCGVRISTPFPLTINPDEVVFLKVVGKHSTVGEPKVVDLAFWLFSDDPGELRKKVVLSVNVGAFHSSPSEN